MSLNLNIHVIVENVSLMPNISVLTLLLSESISIKYGYISRYLHTFDVTWVHAISAIV